MRDEDISLADISQQYEATLFLYEGRPSFCTGIDGNEGKNINIIDLLSQKSKTVPFTFSKVSPPTRIGYVNVDGFVGYISRNPVRKMQVGLSQNNVKISVPGILAGRETEIARKLLRLRSVEIANAMLNDYPSISEAYQLLHSGDVAVAFDHQFCLANDLNIYYKTTKVGVLNVPYKKKPSIENIGLFEKFQHLSCILNGKYENSLRIS